MNMKIKQKLAIAMLATASSFSYAGTWYGTFEVVQAGVDFNIPSISGILKPVDSSIDWHQKCAGSNPNDGTNNFRVYGSTTNNVWATGMSGLMTAAMASERLVTIKLNSTSSPACSSWAGIRIEGLEIIDPQ